MSKLLIGSGVAGALVITLLVGSLVMTVLAQEPTPPAQSQTDTGPDGQFPSYGSSIRVDDAQYEGVSKADEAAALAGLATITSEEDKAAALKANPL